MRDAATVTTQISRELARPCARPLLSALSLSLSLSLFLSLSLSRASASSLLRRGFVRDHKRADTAVSFNDVNRGEPARRAAIILVGDLLPARNPVVRMCVCVCVCVFERKAR